MSAGIIGFILGVFAGGTIGAAIARSLADGRKADDASRISYWRCSYEQASDEYHREKLARDDLLRRCQQLYGMLGTDRCERCDEYCPREGEDHQCCIIADALCRLGVEVPEPRDAGVGFVSQCAEEDE